MPSETKTKVEDLTEEEIRMFLKKMKKTHLYKRIQFIRYRKEGLTHEEIAKRLRVCLRTLTNWAGLFTQGGMKGLTEISFNRRQSKLCAVEEDIRKKVRNGEVGTINQCKDWLEKKHTVDTSESNLRWFLKKNAIVLQKDQAHTRRDA